MKSAGFTCREWHFFKTFWLTQSSWFTEPYNFAFDLKSFRGLENELWISCFGRTDARTRIEEKKINISIWHISVPCRQIFKFEYLKFSDGPKLHDVMCHTSFGPLELRQWPRFCRGSLLKSISNTKGRGLRPRRNFNKFMLRFHSNRMGILFVSPFIIFSLLTL